jgi:competence protein ComEC
MQQRLRDQRYGGVLVALVLGDQRAIGEDDWALFNRTGISHLVSISGLHITMVAGLLALVVSRQWRRSAKLLGLAPAQSAAAVGAMLAAWSYCLLAGWGVPAQRTFFMLTTVAAAMLARLGTRPSTTLALAAGVVTLLDPWAVLAPGFWLSFGAVAAIFFALHGRPAGKTRTWRTHLREAARVQLIVTTALVPLTVVLFQQVSVVSPLANAIAIPLVSLLITPLALVAACFVALPEPFATVAVPLLAFAHALLVLLADVLQWSVQWRAASIALAAPPPWIAVIAVAGAAWLLAPPGWPIRWAGAVWMLPLFIWPAQHPREGEIWVTALDVGQGAALVVETKGRVLLYDSGPRYSPQADAGARIVLPYLRARGIEKVDLFVLSHLDADHSGGAASILGRVEVGEVWTSVDFGHPLLAKAQHVHRCLAGDSSALGRVDVHVLHPTAAEYGLPSRNTNARSCVVELRAATAHVLLTGDLPATQESDLVSRSPSLRTTLLTAPHHGSRNSSSEPFVRATAPTWVVAQAGYRNRFGHPDPGVVARYRAVGAQVARTDFSGAIQWRFAQDGTTTVVRQRIDAARYWHNQPGRTSAAPSEAAPAFDDEAVQMPDVPSLRE